MINPAIIYIANYEKNYINKFVEYYLFSALRKKKI